MLDGSGFVSRSRVFAGNVREHTTLQGMLEGLGAPADALVVMDRGIATEAQIAWLRDIRVPLSRRQPQAQARVDAESPSPSPPRPGTRCIWTEGSARTPQKSA